MIIIINGSLGVGKSSVSWALADKLEKAVMLDGDQIGAIFPRDFRNPEWLAYLYKTIAALSGFHKDNNYDNFVINYVFESEESLNELKQALSTVDDNIKTYWLSCSEDEQRKRIIARNNHQLEWELKRFIKLNTILKNASVTSDIGQIIDNTGLSVAQTVEIIFNSL